MTTKIILCETQQKELVSVEPSALKQRFSVYGVLERNDTVLCVKTHSNNWELPGGAPEAGETMQQALLRELREEVGMSVLIGDLFYIRESFYQTPSESYHSLQLFFKVQSDDQPQVGAEAKEIAFLPLAHITKEDMNTSALLALQHLSTAKIVCDPWSS